MAGRLTGKTALITAAGQGIGRATAMAYATEGATVWATDINPKTLGSLSDNPRITTRVLDVTDVTSIRTVVEEVGTPDILFNCAGFVAGGDILDCTDEDWDFSFNLNVRSMFHMMQAVIPGMAEAGGGSIINMSSVASSLQGVVNRFVYSASKAAVLGMTKSVAADFIGNGIRVNAIAPATVQTPSLDDRINASPDPAQARRDFIARQPMGRLGNPEEIASLAVYLGSDEAEYVTGTVQVIDGGMTL
ncbi:MAG: SDR family oxidoreductase [Dehalococcoidia bacterium]